MGSFGSNLCIIRKVDDYFQGLKPKTSWSVSKCGGVLVWERQKVKECVCRKTDDLVGGDKKKQPELGI